MITSPSRSVLKGMRWLRKYSIALIDELRLRVWRVVVWRDAVGHKCQSVPQDLGPIYLSHHLGWIKPIQQVASELGPDQGVDEVDPSERRSDHHNARAEATVDEIGLPVPKQECVEPALAHRASQQKRVATQRPNEPNSFKSVLYAIGVSEEKPQVRLARCESQLLQPGDYRSDVGFLPGKVGREIECVGDHRSASRSRDQVL